MPESESGSATDSGSSEDQVETDSDDEETEVTGDKIFTLKHILSFIGCIVIIVVVFTILGVIIAVNSGSGKICSEMPKLI